MTDIVGDCLAGCEAEIARLRGECLARYPEHPEYANMSDANLADHMPDTDFIVFNSLLITRDAILPYYGTKRP